MAPSEQSLEFKQLAGGVGGGAAAAPEVNESGKKKAEKAKNEESQQGSNFFALIKSIAQKMLQGSSIKAGAKGSFKETTHPDGSVTLEAEGCLEIAKGSHNSTTCTTTEMKQLQDGTHLIEFRKLIARKNIQGRDQLVYSTNDTVRFIVRDEAELVSLLQQVDPSFGG
jgi:hypothetical protein